MDAQAEHLLTEALKLPADTREDLAVRLMGTVQPSEAEAAEVKQAWVEEIDRRAVEHESGDSAAAIPVEEAWQKITGKQWRAQSADE